MLDLWPYQEKLLEDYDEHRFCIVRKARQVGVSTATCAYAAGKMLERPDFQVGCSTLNPAMQLAIRAKFRKLLGDTRLCVDNKKYMQLQNGSGCSFWQPYTNNTCSYALDLLVIDEAAFMPGIEQIWQELFSCITRSGQAIVVSTPGPESWFRQTYESPGWYQTHLRYDVVPGHDAEWFANISQYMSKRRIETDLLAEW